MKKIIALAAMLAIAASCTLYDSIVGTTGPEITASFENNGTKTTITTNEEGVGTIWWTPSDEINVFYGTTGTHYTSKNKENATTVAFGTTDIIGSTESASENIWGLYPYDEDAECDGSSVTTTIPASQMAVAGAFDDDLFTSLAHSTSTTMTFYNVLGGIKFSLQRDDIQSITFKGNNNEDIAGKVKLEMNSDNRPVATVVNGQKTITLTPKEGTTFAAGTNYYIVLLPTVLSNGFTMTFETATEIGTFEYTAKSVEIKRSVFSKKANIDSYATFAAENLATPFSITSAGNTSVQIAKKSSPKDIVLEYRKGNSNWSTYTIGTSIDLADGEILQFKAGEEGNEFFSDSYSNYYYVKVEGEGTVSVSGNVMSLLDAKLLRAGLPDNAFYSLFSQCSKLTDASNLKLPATALSPSCYNCMFYGCSALTAAPELPAVELASYCYQQMFSNCSSLTTAPELLSTTLAFQCYNSMFSGCSNLTTAPELPATVLASSCYSSMFSGCSSLTTAPELPATNLASYCYSYMFSNCRSLRTAPKLPATNLAECCYYYMFSGCSALVASPNLPATVLASNCYQGMFSNCSSLTTAPELPAVELASYCYQQMFSNCSSLTTAPELPATNLASYCYSSMFSGCSNLTTAPELPATSLAPGCYREMFEFCINLTSAPILLAIRLADACYRDMFYGCKNLKYLKALFYYGYEVNDEDRIEETAFWLNGVSSTGVLVVNFNASWMDLESGCPSGWTWVKNEYVDLGLSVKWANCNAGASSPEEYGGYYQWAGKYDASTKKHIEWSDCPYHTGSVSTSGWSKYIPSGKSSYWYNSSTVDNLTVLQASDDIATISYGNNWRIPTDSEWSELRNTSNCSWQWTTLNGVNGYKITSKKSAHLQSSV